MSARARRPHGSDVVVYAGGEMTWGRRAVPWLARAVEREARGLRLNGVRDPEVEAYVAAAQEALWRLQCSGIGTRNVPIGPDLAHSPLIDPIPAKEAAEMLTCSTRNVVALCTRGSLTSAQRVAGRWLVERAEVLARREQANT